MLPQDAHEHEYRRDENQCERHLRDGSRGERFDVNVGARASVVFFVPAGKSGEEEEGEEGEDEGDDAVEKKCQFQLLCVSPLFSPHVVSRKKNSQ